jgi:hypothetical protein
MGRSVMPNDLTVKAVGPVLGASENTAEPKPETFMPPAQAPPGPAPLIVTNPTLRFDAASGLVVIEFRNETGSVTTSIPTLRQLEAYRQWGPPGQATGGGGQGRPDTAVHPSATGKV